MNHVKGRFPGKKKIFKVVFASSMVIATVGIFCLYCSDYQVTKEPGKQIEHDSTVQSVSELTTEVNSQILETIESSILLCSTKNPVSVSVKSEPVMASSAPIQVETASEPVPDETSVVETEPVRQNKLYEVYEPKENYTYNLDAQYQDYLYEMCIKYDVVEYYELFLAQMFHESRFDIDVISKTNDYGLMQINICNHKWLGQALGNGDFLDPYNNIEAGVYMMSDVLKKYQDVQKALVCYNRGESAVKKGTYSTTYSKCVVSDMSKLVELN